MSATIDMTGETFGRLTVVGRAENTTGGKARWLCRCTCGAEVAFPRTNLLRGRDYCGTCPEDVTVLDGAHPWPRDPRVRVRPDGVIIGPSGAVLSPFPDRDGYLRINVYRDGQWSQHAVHVIVAETFIGPRPDGMHVLHGDDDPGNPAASNLRYGTPKENEADKIRNRARRAQGGTQ